MYICKVINKVKEVRIIPNGSPEGSTGLSYDEYYAVAQAVYQGNWGAGNVRRTRLEEAGYVYDAVQSIVNYLAYIDRGGTGPYAGSAYDKGYFSSGSRGRSVETPVLRAGTRDTHPTNLDYDLYKRLGQEILQGKWDTGPARRTKLENAGYVYEAAQMFANYLWDPNTYSLDMSYFSSQSSDPSIDPDSGDEPTPVTPVEPVVPEGYTKKEVWVYKEDVFHYPPANNSNVVLLSGQIRNEINRAGTFEFQLPPNNTCLKNKLFKKLTSIIEVYWGSDEEPYFRGRIIDSKKAFNGTMTFSCEGMMSVLNDSVVRPLGDSEKGIDAPVGNLFNDLISFHNTQVYDSEDIDSPKYFRTIDIQGYDNTEFNFPYANYEKTLEYIQNNILSNEEVGGRMWVDGQTIHLWADDPDLQTICEQPIVFGENLFDLTQSINAAELYTVILPTGKDGLTIGNPDYIENSSAVSKFGRIWRHVEFNDVESTVTLRTKATEVLNRNIDEVTSIEVSALDLHIVNSDQKPLKVGVYIPVMSPPHGIDVSYICTAASIDICNPANTKYTLGVNPDTLTTRQMKLSNNISQTTLHYKSESSVYNQTLTVYNNRVEIITSRFYRTSNVIHLSVRMKFLVTVSANADTIIFEFNPENNPTTTSTGTGVNETQSKNCTFRAYNTQIKINSPTAIAVDDIVTCEMTWTRA